LVWHPVDRVLNRLNACLDDFSDRLDARLAASQPGLRGVPEGKRLRSQFALCWFGSPTRVREASAEATEQRGNG
jgi:hypothetical protein